MKKVILITGSTDGIGLETAKELALLGHKVLIHGRSEQKLREAEKVIKAGVKKADVECYLADLSSLHQTRNMALSIIQKHDSVDVMINNAGVFKTEQKVTASELDFRFTVNTIAPYLLTKLLLPLLPKGGRVINIASAAQASLMADELTKPSKLNDSQVYAKSKLALMMWTQALAKQTEGEKVLVSVNPKSFLGSKMVKEAYGMEGNDLQEGVEIILRAAFSSGFEGANGLYFDNDERRFSISHSDLNSDDKCQRIQLVLERLLLEKMD